MASRNDRKRRGKNLSQNSTQQQQNTASSSGNVFGNLNEVDISDSDSDLSYITKSSKRSKLSASNPKSKKKNQSNSNSQKPPPLTIVGEAYLRVKMHMDKILNFVKGSYEIKLISSGVQVFPTTTEIFAKIKQNLIENEFLFYTHDLREEQMAKFVLHGYISTSESDLVNKLKEVNITPVQAKKLTIKNKKHLDHEVYLIYFMKNQKIKISQLREIKSLNHIRIKWEYYTNRLKGPIQCSNCQGFGHGGKNCFLRPRCIRCSDFHKSINCPKLIDSTTMRTRTRIPDAELKCSNCGQNHAANYSKCEKRKEFSERRAKYRAKTQQIPSKSFRPAPELNSFNFPALSPNQPHSPQTNPLNYQPSGNNLFTTAQLMEIFSELMTKMQSASTKLQQIQALGEIVIKYASR